MKPNYGKATQQQQPKVNKRVSAPLLNIGNNFQHQQHQNFNNGDNSVMGNMMNGNFNNKGKKFHKKTKNE